MKELWKDKDYLYLKLERASEIDSFIIRGVEEENGGFDFFRGLGIIGYQSTFKAWLRRFPRPIFLVAAKNKQIISWIFVEEWEEVARDGYPVYVLRAIETLPEFRGRRIGFKLFLLVLRETAGHIITKPLTPEAMKFFKRLGFLEEKEMNTSPVDLSNEPSYLVFPAYVRKEMLEAFAEFQP